MKSKPASVLTTAATMAYQPTMMRRFATSLHILFVILYISAYATAAGAEVPRYRFRVGDELVYEQTSHIDPEKETAGEHRPKSLDQMKWQIFVAQKNDDGSWRLLIRASKVFKTSRGAVRARWNSLGYCDVHPNGEYSLDEETAIFKKLMPHELLCRLPLKTEAPEDGWTFQPPVEQLTYHYRMVNGEQGSLVIQGDLDTPYQEMQRTHATRRYHFSPERGLVEKVVYEFHRLGDSIRDRRTVELISVTHWDAESIHRLHLEATDYFAAYKDWIRRRGDADWARSVSMAEAHLKQARKRLAEARQNATTELVKAIYDDNLEEHDASLDWLLEYAQQREQLFADAPSFDTQWQAKNFDGKTTFRLSDRRGEIVVLDFWGTNCEYCVLMAPQIRQLAEEYRGRGVVFLGMFDRLGLDDEVAMRAEEKGAQSLIENVYHGLTILEARDIVDRYRLRERGFGYPAVMVLDQSGVVQEMHLGYSADMTRRMRLLLDRMLRNAAVEKMPAAAQETLRNHRVGNGRRNVPIEVSVRLTQPNPTRATEYMLTVQIEISAGWHAYAAVSEESDLRPLTLQLDLPKDVQADDSWKQPEGLVSPDRPGMEHLTGRVTFSRMLTVTGEGVNAPVGVEVQYQICNDRLCLRPSKVTRMVQLVSPP